MQRKLERDPGVEHAIKAAGDTLVSLATTLGISSAAIAKWQRVPLRHIEKIKRRFPAARRHLMRPDLFLEEDD